MKKPRVVNLRKEKYDIYIGRKKGTDYHFGCPFLLKIHGTRNQVVDWHMEWLEGTNFTDFKQKQRKWVIENLEDLEGKRIGCFCAPKRCHGDNYVKIFEEGVKKWKKRISKKGSGKNLNS